MKKRKKKVPDFQCALRLLNPTDSSISYKGCVCRQMLSAQTSTMPVSRLPLRTHQKLTYLSLMVE